MKYNWSKQNILDAVYNSDSYTDVLRYMNVVCRGNNYRTLKEKIKEYNIDISHFSFGKNIRKTFKYVSAINYLYNGSDITSSVLKEKLIREHIKENRCEKCGITSWNNEYISMLLHHKDGNSKNNKLDNLQLLCPNCHAQTDNFCGKNILKVNNYCKDCGAVILKTSTYCPACEKNHRRVVINRPSKEELITQFKTYKCISKVALIYGITDNALRKWFKKYEMPTHINDLKNLYL